MAIQITIDAIVSGTPPYNVWVTDNCGNAGVSQYINTFSTSAYTFTLPTVFETYPIYYVKIIDANNCQYCISPPIENCNMFVGSWDTNSYYKYNLVSDTDENITFSTPPQIDDSIFGNTDNKIWFRTNTGITEAENLGLFMSAMAVVRVNSSKRVSRILDTQTILRSDSRYQHHLNDAALFGIRLKSSHADEFKRDFYLIRMEEAMIHCKAAKTALRSYI